MTKQRFPVLVATDGSEASNDAVLNVTVFPWPAAVRVHGVVVQSAARLAGIPAEAWARIEEGFTGVARSARATLARRWPDAEVRVVGGRTVEAIVTRARQVGARVIVLGSHGHGPVARLLVGSVSLGVVRRMSRAALVMRGRARGFTRVAVGLDGSAHSRRAVAFVAALAVPRGGQVTLISVHEPVAAPSLALMPAATRAAVQGQLTKANATDQARIRREVDAAAAVLRRAGWKVRSVIRQGSPLHELLAATRSARAQLLAVGARGASGVERLLLGSVCEGALHRAPVSVLVVR